MKTMDEFLDKWKRTHPFYFSDDEELEDLYCATKKQIYMKMMKLINQTKRNSGRSSTTQPDPTGLLSTRIVRSYLADGSTWNLKGRRLSRSG